MSAFTSTLPDDLFALLGEHLEKAEYVKSYKEASDDSDILLIAEEGMEEYLKQPND